jgi:hypothetical protein
MASADSIRDNLDRVKNEAHAKQEVAKAFNVSAKKLIDKFMDRVTNGDIELDSVQDMSKIYGIWKDINDLDIDGNSGTGTIPELNMAEEGSIESRLNVVKTTAVDMDGQTSVKKEVNLEDLANLSVEDVNQLMNDRGKVLNDENTKNEI